MKFATFKDGTRDGRLALVSRDLRQAVSAEAIAPNLLWALDHWEAVAPKLELLYAQLNDGKAAGAFGFDTKACAAPLPRASQWLDGSDFPNHGQWVCAELGIPALPSAFPMMYQGGSDDLLGACDDMLLPDEAHQIDIEGELIAVLGAVPMGTSAGNAGCYIRLLMLANDCSLRGLQVREMQSGFGMVHAKPSTSFSPVAVTLDEVSPWWRGNRLHRKMLVHRNGEQIGQPDAGLMRLGFGPLIAHAAKTRRLTAGTLIGSGTVSDPAEGAGSAAIAEMRALEQHRSGNVTTPYLKFGETVRMEMLDDAGQSIFGAIENRIVQALPVEEALSV